MLNLESDCTEKGRYSRMMPPPGLQVDFWPCATLIFDILTRKVDRFIPLPRGLLVPFCIKIGSFVRFQNVVFISLVTDKRTNKQTNERTNTMKTCFLQLPVWPGGRIKIHRISVNWLVSEPSRSTKMLYYYVLL